MDKVIKMSYNIQEKHSLSYRFINIASIETGESVNIGMVIEIEGKSPNIKFIDNIEIVKELFPIFDIGHIEFCKKAIEIKYKMKKVQKDKLSISKTVSISNTRLYNIEYDKLKDIETILFDKYISLQRTQNIFYHFIKKLRVIKDTPVFEKQELFDVPIVTKTLISNKIGINNQINILKRRIEAL